MTLITRQHFDMNNKNLSWYLSGYTDGEGSFIISFSPRKKLKVGVEVRPSFAVAQRKDRAESLYLFKDLLKCGDIRFNKSDKTLKFEVRSIKDLMETVIPFFDKYPLLSSKISDYKIFKKICKMIFEGKHLEKQGLKSIINQAYKMNGLGARRYSKTEILSYITK